MPALFLVPLLAAFVVGDVTIRGKEALFIYKKAPSGVGRLIKARLMQGSLVAVPIAAAITAVTAILGPQTAIIPLLTNTGIIMLVAAAYVAFSLGLFLLMPAYTQKSVSLKVFIVPQVSVVMFIVYLVVLRLPWLHYILLYILSSWMGGIVLLFLGKRKLSRIE